MAATSLAKPGPIRTAKTPKRVRFAGEDRDQTRLIRQQEADKRDARHIPRVDVSIHFSPCVSFPFSLLWCQLPRLELENLANDVCTRETLPLLYQRRASQQYMRTCLMLMRYFDLIRLLLAMSCPWSPPPQKQYSTL